jgi:hypothetical protein
MNRQQKKILISRIYAPFKNKPSVVKEMFIEIVRCFNSSWLIFIEVFPKRNKMKRIFYLLFCLISSACFSQNFDWTQRATGLEREYGKKIVTDPSGNSYCMARLADTVHFGSINLVDRGGGDVIIIKYDHQGTLKWIRQLGGPGPDEGRGICLDRDGNVYVTGGFAPWASCVGQTITTNGSNDLFLLKLDSLGTVKLLKNHGDSIANYGNSISVDSLGNMYVAGANVAYQYNGYFVSKYDVNGNQVWTNQVPSNYQQADHLQTMPDGTSWVVGGGVGDFGSFHNHIEGAYISKYDSNGNLLLAKSYPRIWFNQIAWNKSKTFFYVKGELPDSLQMDGVSLVVGHSAHFVAKFDSNAIAQWAVSLVPYTSQILGISLSDNDDVFLTGYFMHSGTINGMNATIDLTTTPDQNGNMYIAALDSTGNGLWSLSPGGIFWDNEGRSVSYANGFVYVTGGFSMTTTFGSTTYVANTGVSAPTDFFISRISPPGIISGISDNNDTSWMAVYPNPAYGIVNVDVRGFEGPCYLECSNALGQVLTRRKINASQQTQTLDLSAMDKGVYYVKITSKDKRAVKKLVHQ